MPTLEERFWALVQKCRHGQTCSRCCWEWQGPRNHAGYGMFFLGKPPRQIMSHVFALELTHGAGILYPLRVYTWSDGSTDTLRKPWGRLFLGTHRCDNPPCVNPRHVRLGTPGDNMRDAQRKGRVPVKRLPQREVPHAATTAAHHA